MLNDEASRQPTDGGFTMVELAVVLGILSLVLAVMGNVLMSVTHAANQGEALIANEQQSTLAMTQIARDLRAAYPLTEYPEGSVPTTTYQSKVEMTLVPTGAGRSVSAALTAGSTTITSSGAFTTSDVNALVSGNGITTGTRILSYTDSSDVVISNPPGITANNVTLTVVRSSTVTWTFDPTARTLSRTVQQGAGPSSTRVVLTNVLNSSTQPVFSYYDAAKPGIELVATGSNQTISVCTSLVRIFLVSQSDPGPLPFTETKDVQLRNYLATVAAADPQWVHDNC